MPRTARDLFVRLFFTGTYYHFHGDSGVNIIVDEHKRTWLTIFYHISIVNQENVSSIFEGCLQNRVKEELNIINLNNFNTIYSTATLNLIAVASTAFTTFTV